MTSEFTYTIELPKNTSMEVVDWFASMNKANQLSVELIGLVSTNLKCYYNNNSNFNNQTFDESMNNKSKKQTDIQDKYIHNLYNWQESNNALFQETNNVKKEKKKMLSI